MELMGLELESELGTMELVEPSLNILCVHDILCKFVLRFSSQVQTFKLSFGGGE